MPRAEDVVAATYGSKGIGYGVPEPCIIAATLTVPHQDLAGSQQRHMHSHDRPRKWPLPLADLGRVRRWKWRAANGGIHVSLDFALRQGTVVDPDVIDSASEVFAPDRVAAHTQGAAGAGDAARYRFASYLGAVDIQPEGR